MSFANPVLTRELRAALRNVRAFALLAVYVAVLGAIVVSQFPANQEISFQGGNSAKGQDLFWMFVGAQAFLVVVLFPALSSGALAQERERRTLEPLLLTPLTPLQIVWGKAGGVLSLAALLLVSTLPLTSLSFLLGGVSPGELFGAYALLLGLCLFTTAIGLYCSARWSNTTQATVACYVMLPFLLGFIVLFSAVGAMVSGVLMIFLMLYGLVLLWRRWSQSRVAQKLGGFWQPLLWILMLASSLALLGFMAWGWNLGLLFFAVIFGTSYFAITSQWGLLQAAHEIARRPEPRNPLRQRVQDWQNEWKPNATLEAKAGSTQQVVYLPDPARPRAAPTSTFAATVRDATAHENAPQSTAPPGNNRPADTAFYGQKPAPAPSEITYGVKPFLSDKLNPVFARDLRSGLLGRFDYLLRFSYVMVILSELFLLFVVAGSSGSLASSDQNMFLLWARLHLGLVMVAAAWLGARAIAPEREGQTLPQLFTTPMTAAEIVRGKIMAVMVYSLYVFVMGLPLVILLAILDVIPWLAAIHFLLAEIVFGASAAAWGMLCSIQFFSVRRAVGGALGGIIALLVGAPLLMGVLIRALTPMNYYGGPASGLPANYYWWSAMLSSLLPMQALSTAIYSMSGRIGLVVAGNATSISAAPFYWALLFYLAIAGALLWWTTRLFHRYAQSA